RVDVALGTLPVNLHILAAAEELFVLAAEPVRFGPVEGVGRVNLPVERDREGDFGERPVLAQALVERTGNVNRLVVGELRFDLPRKLTLVFGNQVRGFPGD